MESQGADHPSEGSTDPCEDYGWNISDGHWETTLNWEFKDRSAPTENGITQTDAVYRLRQATQNMGQGQNSCNLDPDYNAEAQYTGLTQGGPNISVSSTCTSPDRQNIVSFGNLASGHLGYSCWWWDTSGVYDMIDADFKLNKEDGFRWYAKEPAGCNVAFSIEAVATHERGHTFGLYDVSENGHPNLTMSSALNGACQASESSLGIGDVMGMRQEYV